MNCGVFAIANVVEFCINGYTELENCTRDWDFDEGNMRNHLVKCIKDGKFTCFPKVDRNCKLMDFDREFIDVSCKGKCGLPDLFCDLIECDRCNCWFHKICGEVDKDDTDKWFCNACKSNNMSKRTIRKPRVLDL